MKAVTWTDSRRRQEKKFYERPFTKKDLSAKKSSELFLPKNFKASEAYQHQQRHGFTVFPEILSDETATNLRNFVDSRNGNLTELETIYAIANEKIDTRSASVPMSPLSQKAMMEIGNNERFTESIEKIFGKDPALIEMTTITGLNNIGTMM